MKKYALLILLFCVTMAFGTLFYQAAYQHTVAASAQESTLPADKDTRVKEDAFSDATKELAREGGKSVTRFLFSLIYK
ncbi:hypothetical protein [Leadbetterella sp. DM7]|uniref:hypothetical protein n=1 Tax=Leadbetterella sp. DM7 TaxID=3235085 RepID=UPI00349E72CB